MTERGSATVLMVGAIGLLGTLVVAVAAIGLALAVRAQATTAADAAALAAAVATYPSASRTDPLSAASSAAAANGARLVQCQCPVDETLAARVVRVAVSVPVNLPTFGKLEINAAARAEFDPRRWLGR